ncbi:hypothetical protein [Photobacterium damselae]|uniref:hypothetical protein n=1 Tax=Photobacterium damselae TaxID=38293 RepID=UPI00406876C2
MKKLITLLLTVIFIALVPVRANVIGRAFRVSSVIDLSLLNKGDYITITGYGGGDIKEGLLAFDSLGNMGSNIIDVEVRKYNVTTNEVGPILSDSDATEVSWALFTDPKLKVNNKIITSKKVNLFLGNDLVTISSKFSGSPSKYSRVGWQVKSESSLDDVLDAGDNVEVQSVVMVTVTF